LVAFFAAFFLATIEPPSKGSRRVLFRFFKPFEGHPQVLALNKRTSYRPSNLLRQSLLIFAIGEVSLCDSTTPLQLFVLASEKNSRAIEHFSQQISKIFFFRLFVRLARVALIQSVAKDLV
jgi:hypothetical protein